MHYGLLRDPAALVQRGDPVQHRGLAGQLPPTGGVPYVATSCPIDDCSARGIDRGTTAGTNASTTATTPDPVAQAAQHQKTAGAARHTVIPVRKPFATEWKGSHPLVSDRDSHTNHTSGAGRLTGSRTVPCRLEPQRRSRGIGRTTGGTRRRHRSRPSPHTARPARRSRGRSYSRVSPRRRRGALELAGCDPCRVIRVGGHVC